MSECVWFVEKDDVDKKIFYHTILLTFIRKNLKSRFANLQHRTHYSANFSCFCVRMGISRHFPLGTKYISSFSAYLLVEYVKVV